METVRFDELDLYPQVLRAIKEMGFEEATPIQSQAIPVVMSGVDVIGQAQTGTGDQGIKRRCTDHYRHTGTCHGSSPQKNDPLRGSQYDRFR